MIQISIVLLNEHIERKSLIRALIHGNITLGSTWNGIQLFHKGMLLIN